MIFILGSIGLPHADIFGSAFQPTVVPSSYPFNADYMKHPHSADYVSLPSKVATLPATSPPNSMMAQSLKSSPSRTPTRSPSDCGSGSPPSDVSVTHDEPKSAFVPIKSLPPPILPAALGPQSSPTQQPILPTISPNYQGPLAEKTSNTAPLPVRTESSVHKREGTRNELKAPTALISQRISSKNTKSRTSPSPTKLSEPAAMSKPKPVWRPY